MDNDLRLADGDDGRHPDPREGEAVDGLRRFFDERPQQVYFSRQLEVIHEGDWFHWVTNRALKDLIRQGLLESEPRDLASGGRINVIWPHRYRYYRRDAARLVRLVEEYADPNVGGALGLHGEAMVLEGFARRQFVMKGRNTRSFGARSWTKTAHNLDFVFERDGLPYGIEVKNTLQYMPYEELQVKLDLCDHLGLRAVFAVRMLPKSWMKEVIDRGGFALILKYQLYPWSHRELAGRVREQLELPVDSPQALREGTMDRFVNWHVRQTP